MELAGTINEQAEALDEIRDTADLAREQSRLAQVEIENIYANGILDRAEKYKILAELENTQAQRRAVAAIIGQYQAAAEWTAYQAAHDALIAYYNGLVPPITDTEVATPADRATGVARWAAYSEAHQMVWNAMAGYAKTVSLWTGVSGPGKPEDNATVGAPVGTEVAGKPAEVLLDEVQTIDNNLSDLGLEVAGIGSKVEAIDTDLEDAKARITDLFTTYGSTIDAAASAQQSEAAKLASQQARDASLIAQQNAQLASGNAAQARDQAVTASASANESKVLAVQAETAAQRAAGALMPSSFEFGDEYWYVFESSAGSGYAAVFNGQHYRGIEIQPQGYGMFRNRYPLQVMPGNRVRVKVRLGNWSASSPNPRSYIRFTYYDGQLNRIIFHDAQSLALSIPQATYEHVAEADIARRSG